MNFMWKVDVSICSKIWNWYLIVKLSQLIKFVMREFSGHFLQKIIPKNESTSLLKLLNIEGIIEFALNLSRSVLLNVATFGNNYETALKCGVNEINFFNEHSLFQFAFHSSFNLKSEGNEKVVNKAPAVFTKNWSCTNSSLRKTKTIIFSSPAKFRVT